MSYQVSGNILYTRTTKVNRVGGKEKKRTLKTTIPLPIAEALGIKHKDEIRWTLLLTKGGRVIAIVEKV